MHVTQMNLAIVLSSKFSGKYLGALNSADAEKYISTSGTLALEKNQFNRSLSNSSVVTSTAISPSFGKIDEAGSYRIQMNVANHQFPVDKATRKSFFYLEWYMTL